MKMFFITFFPMFFIMSFGQNFKIKTVQMKLSSGSIQRVDSFISKYVTARNVDVWLPENYSKKNKYSVLYMHDGQMLFDSTNTWNKQEWAVDETVGKLIENSEIVDCIVVGIWNVSEERHSDYFPQKPFESLPKVYADSLINESKRYENVKLFTKNVQSDNYLRFIVYELKPFIDNTFSTRTDADNTFIAGSSMGGLISMYAICEYPEIFGGAACLSTHWPGAFSTENNPVPQTFFDYMKEKLPDSKTHKIYFDYGTETLDAVYEPFQKQADLIMIDKGFTEKKWITKKFDGADHSENAWQQRLHVPLKFLLGKH